jgi:hypothetical protein
MHIFKAASLSAIMSAALVNVALAADAPPKCPGAKDIAAQKDNNSITCSLGTCTYTMEKHRFDTDLYWEFVMKAKAATPDEAKSKIDDALDSLAYESGPTQELLGNYYCRYTNSYGFESIATYAPDSSFKVLFSS